MQLNAIFKSWREKEQRIWRVASPLERNATGLCPDNIGYRSSFFPLVGLDEIESEWKTAAVSAGYKALPSVGEVTMGSPADRGGLQAGDEIVSIGEHVFEGPGKVQFSEMDYSQDPQGNNFVVRREGLLLTLFVGKEEFCRFPTQLVDAEDLNAWADGEFTYITTRMVNFASDDQDLAFILSHELAHNIMAHIDAKATNAMGGLIVDLAIVLSTGVDTGAAFTKAASQAYSHEFEAEADYVALYLMARSNLEIDGAEEFWREMAVATGDTGEFSSTHPSSPERFVAMQGAIQEIKRKIANGEELKPNMAEK